MMKPAGRPGEGAGAAGREGQQIVDAFEDEGGSGEEEEDGGEEEEE
jgi:hypothetical protein